MIKKLTKHGNSLALVIDKGILELLNIDATTPLKISTDGRQLFISPTLEPAQEKKLRPILDRMYRKYGRALKRLKD
jgi:antitoxin MazE